MSNRLWEAEIFMVHCRTNSDQKLNKFNILPIYVIVENDK